TALRLVAQAELLLGNAGDARDVLASAAAVAAERGGKVDRLAILALSGAQPVMSKRDPLAFAVRWSTGGVVELE
ncbi:MAG: hypothetical protein HOV81_04715, partial [Kofleriaceae bacterium]|nr:hypothetical protein [Kofleriaceae bacterium]